MREDMAKVIVERPRILEGLIRKGRRVRDIEDQPRFLGMRRHAKERGGEKLLNENLAPLRRYLERQAGRPWNKVNSEIRARIDVGNEVQAHTLTHIDQFLHLNVRRVAPSAEAPCGLAYQSDFGWLHRVREGDLYVDPDDGLIKRAKLRYRKQATRRPARPGRVALGDGRLGVCVKGAWYGVRAHTVRSVRIPAGPKGWVQMLEVDGEVAPAWDDPVVGLIWGHESHRLDLAASIYGAGFVGSDKRQLTSRELKRHGLVNSPPQA